MRAQEAFRAYRMNMVTATQEARQLIEAQLRTVFKNCDVPCFSQCNTYYGNDLFGYTQCVGMCQC